MKKSIYKLLILIILIILSYNVFTILYKNIENKVEISSYINNPTSYNNYYKGMLYIPKIDLKTTIKKANKDYSNLDNSLVYYKDLNTNNRIIIFGHSGAGYGTYFSRINELKNGEKAYLYHQNYVHEYTVYDIKKINETDLSILNDTKNKEELYLVTCIKNDKKSRLVIKLRQKSVKKA